MNHLAKKILAMSILAASGLMVNQAWSAPANIEQQTFTSKTYVVKPNEIKTYAVVPGSVLPEQQAKLASRVMGYIRSFEVSVGEYVRRGDLLLSIDPTDVKSMTKQAEAQLAQAKAALADAKADLDRFTKLHAQGSIPQQQLDKVKLAYQVAQENVNAAQAGLDQAKGQTQYTEVRSPFDGVVIQKMAVSGDLATPGVPVVVLENLNSLTVNVAISTDLYRQLNKDTTALVLLDGEEANAHSAKVLRMVAAANPMTRKHIVKLVPTDKIQMTSGQFARVKFEVGHRETLMIPQSAVILRGGIESVILVDENNIAHLRSVRTGLTQGDMVEIQAGVLSGDRVLVDGSLPVGNGDKILSE